MNLAISNKLKTAFQPITRAKRGFTLIELLIVISIIGILGTALLASYNISQARARDARRQSDLSVLRNNLEIYYADKRAYPATGGSWQDISTALSSLVPTYIKVISADPKPGSKAYRYRDVSSGQGYCLEADLETATSVQNSCTVGIETDYDYGVGNP